ncbi:MAG: hypothetical protein JWN14_1571 [Chthonomonadales bacterium]|nr:hypothetical protein [Chthonomonadales bacterium]
MASEKLEYNWIPAITRNVGRAGYKIQSIILHSTDGHRASDILVAFCIILPLLFSGHSTPRLYFE